MGRPNKWNLMEMEHFHEHLQLRFCLINMKMHEAHYQLSLNQQSQLRYAS